MLTATIFITLLPVSASRADPPPTAKPEFNVGDWWEFTGRYMRQKCTRWDVVQADPNGLLEEQCDGLMLYRDYANHLEVVRVTEAGEDVLTNEPALRELEFPLEVGNTWNQQYWSFTADNQGSWFADASWEVKAYESVTVAAGTFDAYRIEMVEARQVGTIVVTITSNAWWSPAVKMFVKQDHYDPRMDFELSAFGLGQGE